MCSKHFLQLFAVIAIPFLASCGSSVEVLSKNDIKSGKSITPKVEKHTVATPSATLLTQASTKPKDKHSMPIYKFGERQRIVRTTAYTCSEDDHIIYGSKNATGTNLRYSDKVRSAAADWSFYPVGTVFRIKGMNQLFVVDDYGSALTGTGTIDLYKPCTEYMNQWGRRNVEISVVQWGSFKRSAEILKGRTGYSHCRQMLSNIERQMAGSENVAKN
ncbi:3D domain-containing protein [Luteolibacter sp. AS25]|uniref:3D domain-containing protein n=1 Tax=Luteolibacter sp. AS25 TaxID=3135776 RepID=UPI00398A7DAC